MCGGSNKGLRRVMLMLMVMVMVMVMLMLMLMLMLMAMQAPLQVEVPAVYLLPDDHAGHIGQVAESGLYGGTHLQRRR